MGWLKRILQGSTSNSRRRYNGSCEVDDCRSCSFDPSDLEDEPTEGEETEYQITRIRSFSEDGQVMLIQMNGECHSRGDLFGAATTKDWVQYEEIKLEDEDERPTQPYEQSWALESSLSDPANIFQPFPFSFYPDDGKKYHGSYEDDDRRYSDEVNDSAEGLMDRGEDTYHRVPSSSSDSGEGQGEYLFGAGWATTYGPMQYEVSPMQHGDEQLSEAFDQSLAIGPSSLFGIGSIFPPSPFSFYLDNGHTFQHPECIHPYAFDDPIVANHEGEDHFNQNIHYKEPRHPICYVCGKPIQVDASGHFQYAEHPFWPAKYCRRHDRDGTPLCFCCERLEPRGTTYSTLNDGRSLCPECLDSAIMNSHECKPLEREIRKFYERLDMKVHQPTIPLYLLDREGMKERRVGKKGHHRVCGDLGAIRVLSVSLGLTTFFKGPNIYATVEKRTIDEDNKIIEIKTEQHKLVGYSNVEEIKVLYGCARLFTGHTLAHEMMHAWLALEGYHDLTGEVEEGFCQVMAHMWLDSQILAMSKNKFAPSPQLDFERRLAEYLQHRIKVRTDEYGTGFHLVKGAMDIYGLKGTLNHIRMTGSFPR